MNAVVDPTPHRVVKSEAAFRTISEVAEDLDVPQHVLRFWESRFPQIKPLKRGGGRRYYRPTDVQLLRRIRDLLYKDGYTIKGVQKLLRDGVLKVSDLPPAQATQPDLPMGDALAGAEAADDDDIAGPEDAPVPLVAEEAAPAADVVTGLNVAQKSELRDILGDLRALRDILHRAS